jgi:hypothetical protein
VIGSEILLFTGDRSLITFAFHISGASIQITLQNHLSCYLIDVASGISCLLAGITQRPLGCDGCQALVPGNNRAWQNGAQFFYKLKNFSCGCSYLSVHPARNASHDMIDFSFADDFRETGERLLVGWNCLERMR